MQKSQGLKALERLREKKIKQALKARMSRFYRGNIPLNTCGYFWHDLKSFLYDFCVATSMNGFCLITAKKLSLNENRLWAVICISALVFCTYLMGTSWDKSLKQSTLIQLHSIDNSINELDFPAVTVCNHNQIYKPEAEKLFENLTGAGFTNQQIEQFFQSLPVLIRPLKSLKVDAQVGSEILQHLNIPVKELMRQLMQPCENFITGCKWVGKPYNCSALFKVAESYLGYCCAFNYRIAPLLVDYENETRCRSYYEKIDLDKDIQCEVESECPGRKAVLRVPGSGLGAKLHFFLHLEPIHYLGLTKDFEGASLLIHDSHDYPEDDIYEQAIQISEQKIILMKGMQIQSEKEIRQLPLEIRKCAFPDELQYEYSYLSCIAKCRMIRFAQVCGCVPFYFPATCKSIEKTCDFSNTNCMKHNIGLMSRLHERIILENGDILSECTCIPMCDKVIYTATAERATILRGYRYPYLSENDIDKKFNHSKTSVYFQDYTFIKYRRRITTSWHQGIGFLGGILGLCLGGSLISLLEPIVDFLITLFRRYNQRRQVK